MSSIAIISFLQAVCKTEYVFNSLNVQLTSDSSSLLFVNICRNSYVPYPPLALMSLHNGSDKSNSYKTAKATAAIPIAGILVAAALLSGLLSIFGSETAIAQQNMTGTNATGMNATGTSAIETLGG